MLMDFQMEDGQAITAEITVEMQDLSERYRTPSHESSNFELPASVWMDNAAYQAQILTVPILLAVFACAFAVIRALV